MDLPYYILTGNHSERNRNLSTNSKTFPDFLFSFTNPTKKIIDSQKSWDIRFYLSLQFSNFLVSGPLYTPKNLRTLKNICVYPLYLLVFIIFEIIN